MGDTHASFVCVALLLCAFCLCDGFYIVNYSDSQCRNQVSVHQFGNDIDYGCFNGYDEFFISNVGAASCSSTLVLNQSYWGDCRHPNRVQTYNVNQCVAGANSSTFRMFHCGDYRDGKYDTLVYKDYQSNGCAGPAVTSKFYADGKCQYSNGFYGRLVCYDGFMDFKKCDSSCSGCSSVSGLGDCGKSISSGRSSYAYGTGSCSSPADTHSWSWYTISIALGALMIRLLN